MSQNVSSQFIEEVKSPIKTPEYAVRICWDRSIKPSAGFFTLNSSRLDGGDFTQGGREISTLFDKYNYTDESQFVAGFKISRKVSKFAWGLVSATATITLNNASGRFTPNGVSEIAANVKAGRPIQIMAGYKGELIPVFTGFCGVPSVNIENATVEIEAFDTITFFADKKSSIPYFVNKTVKEMLVEVLREQGFADGQYRIDGSFSKTYDFYYLKEKTIAEFLREIAENEGALILAEESGVLRIIELGANSTPTPVWRFNYDNLKSLAIDEADIINSVRVKSTYLTKPRQMNLYELENSGDDYKILPNNTAEWFLDYKNEVKYALEIAEPVVEFNTKSDKSGRSVALVGKGYNLDDKYKFTVKNTDREPVFLTKMELRGLGVEEREARPVKIDNIESIEKYGINPDGSTGMIGQTLDIQTRLPSRDGFLRMLGEAVVNRYSEPSRQFKVSNFAVPHLQIGDTVSIKVENINRTYECVVLGIELDFGDNANFTQNLWVQVVPVAKYFILSQSRLDSGRVLDI